MSSHPSLPCFAIYHTIQNYKNFNFVLHLRPPPPRSRMPTHPTGNLSRSEFLPPHVTGIAGSTRRTLICPFPRSFKTLLMRCFTSSRTFAFAWVIETNRYGNKTKINLLISLETRVGCY